jgi:spore coat polysaccharide biosynthesis protein SpsF
MALTGIILQVRIASMRLPGKLMLPLCGMSIFEHILLRLLKARLPRCVIVATTGETEPLIEGIVKRYGVSLHVGSEDDVLLRFIEARRRFRIDTVVRATGDNPLVCIPYIDRAISLHLEKASDLTLFPLLPYGTGVEVITGGVLEEIHGRTQDPFEREHITQYLYRREFEYRIVRGVPEADLQKPDVRLTIDTEEDYRAMCEIYEALYRGEPIGLREVLQYLKNR